MKFTPITIKSALITCTSILFISSLFFPALLFQYQKSLPGFQILAWGWWGILTLDFAWFANPIYLIGLMYLKKEEYVAARYCSAGALVLGASSFSAKEWWFNEGSGTPIMGLGSAFYIWMLSFLLLFIGSFFVSAPNKALERDSAP